MLTPEQLEQRLFRLGDMVTHYGFGRTRLTFQINILETEDHKAGVVRVWCAGFFRPAGYWRNENEPELNDKYRLLQHRAWERLIQRYPDVIASILTRYEDFDAERD